MYVQLNCAIVDADANKVLDVGCGLGYLTYALNEAGYQATGIDVSSQAIAAGRTAAELAEQLAGTVKGYQPCPGRGGEGACLRSTANADHRGVLRVRVLKTLAVVVVCLRTDQLSVDRGCDLVFNHIKVTS